MATEKRLIDANELAETYCNIDEKFCHEPWALSDILDFLNDAPTVDAVEVVHARWLSYDEHNPDWWGYTDTHLYCSACMEEANSQYNYCPNCGAKMDGDGNG